jgi:REP element-mobilizing transposase RayT
VNGTPLRRLHSRLGSQANIKLDYGLRGLRGGITGTPYQLSFRSGRVMGRDMARLTRIVVPDLPHHVTQRGNRRQALFLEDGDYALCRDLLAERCKANGVACWAYCLMPNHVHLILAPRTPEGLARSVGEAHRRYTAYFNGCSPSFNLHFSTFLIVNQRVVCFFAPKL